jgi:hypothetical protein
LSFWIGCGTIAGFLGQTVRQHPYLSTGGMSISDVLFTPVNVLSGLTAEN